jgi:hypothetical protein
VTVRAEPLADRGAGPALPDDRGVDGTACLALPDDRRLTLVGDPDCGEIRRRETGARDGFAAYGNGRREDLVRIVLDVRRRGIRLPDLAICASSDRTGLIENDRARAGRPLIEREDRGHSVLKWRIGSTSRR